MAQTAIIKSPLTLRWGVPFEGTITFTPGGVPMDLTGLKVTANLHQGTPEEPGASVYAISTTNGKLVVSSPASGTATFALSGEDIEDLSAGDYIMPVFILNGSDEVISGGHPFIRYVQVTPSGFSP